MERESDKMKKLVNVKIEFNKEEKKFYAIETYELLVRPSALLRQILREDGLLGKKLGLA